MKKRATKRQPRAKGSSELEESSADGEVQLTQYDTDLLPPLYSPNGPPAGTAAPPADPITWAVAGKFIAARLGDVAVGALGAMGAEIWAILNGRMSIEDLYRATTKEFKKMLSAAFAEHELNEAIDSMNSAADALAVYQTAPARRAATLDDAEHFSRASFIRFQSARHTVAGYGNFTIAAGLHLAVMEERYLEFKDPDEITAIEGQISRFCDHIEAANPQMLEATREGFWGPMPKNDAGWSRRGGTTSATSYWLHWQYDGVFYNGPRVEVARGGIGQPSLQARQSLARQRAYDLGSEAFEAHVKREQDKTQAEIIDAGNKIARAWKRIPDALRALPA